MAEFARGFLLFVALCAGLAACSGGAAQAGDGSGWDSLVELRGEVRGGHADFANLLNLAALIGEDDYARCMRDGGIDYVDAPAWPQPDPEITSHLEDWATPEQELAGTMLGPVENLDRYGLGEAYRSYSFGAATLWTRQWVVAVGDRNAAVYDGGAAIDVDNVCAWIRVEAEGWLYTQSMHDLTTEFGSLIDQLTDDLDLRECGPNWIYGDRDGEPFGYLDAGLDFPTASQPARAVWLDSFADELGIAEEHQACRSSRLTAGDREIADAVGDFRDQHEGLISQAATDWDETQALLDDLTNGRIELVDQRIEARRSWLPEWAMQSGTDSAS